MRITLSDAAKGALYSFFVCILIANFGIGLFNIKVLMDKRHVSFQVLGDGCSAVAVNNEGLGLIKFMADKGE